MHVKGMVTTKGDGVGCRVRGGWKRRKRKRRRKRRRR